MPEYLDDPSVLTKEKLKSELLAHNVELPSGNPTKDVYVQLYLKNLTAQNQKHAAAALDAFSSDEELPPAVVSGRSRSSGRKATRKTEKVQTDDPDVTALTDEGLRDELLKHGEDAGPIVASTRKLYEKKLQKLLDGGPGPLPSTDVLANHNGNGESDIYSDKEDEVFEPEPVTEPVPEPEPEPEPEPVVVVERLTRSRGKTPVTTRTRSSQHQKEDPDVLPDVLMRKQKQQKITGFLSSCNPPTRTGRSFRQVEKISASEQTPKVQEKDVLKELFPNDINSLTGITATCRRPIRGAAGRPVVYDDLWNDENGLLKTSSFSTESHVVHRVISQPLPPPLTASSFTPSSASPTSSRVLAAAPPAGQTRAVRRGMPLWMKLTLLCIVAAFLFLVYQAMETNYSGPFSAQDAESVGESTA